MSKTAPKRASVPTKSAVYSWRVAPATLQALEDEARREKVSVATLIEQATAAWLQKRRAERSGEDAEQSRLHAAIRPFIGCMKGLPPSSRVSEVVRERLLEKLRRGTL